MSHLIKILGIDTSTDACSVALSMNGNINIRYEWAPKNHARLLLPMIDSLLKENEITIRDIDAFAFGQGPGSFTGIRIACSVIQAFAFGTSKPVIPISTLRAQAQRAYRELGVKRVFASLDARMQEVYWGLFELESHHPVMKSISLERVEPTQKVVLPPGVWHKATGSPHALDIVLIANYEYQQGYKISAEEAFPTYLRDEVVKKS